MVGTILQVILAILQAIPTLKGWFEELALLYFKGQIINMKAENKAALVHLVTQNCQVEVERLIGYSHAGKPSGIDGAVIVGELPNVGVVQHTNPQASGSGDLAQQQPTSP